MNKTEIITQFVNVLLKSQAALEELLCNSEGYPQNMIDSDIETHMEETFEEMVGINKRGAAGLWMLPVPERSTEASRWREWHRMALEKCGYHGRPTLSESSYAGEAIEVHELLDRMGVPWQGYSPDGKLHDRLGAAYYLLPLVDRVSMALEREVTPKQK